MRLAKEAGISVIMIGKVQGIVGSRQKDVPPLKAMEMLAESNGCRISSAHGFYIVHRKDWVMPQVLKAEIGSLTSRPQDPASSGNKSLKLENVDIRQLLQAMAKEAGVSIILSDEVKGTVTARLAGMPPEKAMRLILQSRG